MGVVQDGLVLWLDARAQRQLMKDGQSKSIWKDLSGNGNDGVLKNFNFTKDSGWGDGRLKFDGVDDKVNIQNKDIYNAYNYSYEFNLTLLEGYTGSFRKFLNRSSYAGDSQPSFYFYSTNNGLHYTFRFTDGSNGGVNVVNCFPVGKNVHVVATFSFDGATSVAKVYIDGELRQWRMYDKEPELHVSIFELLGNNAKYRLSAFKLYNRVLTDEEILQNYRAAHFLLEPKTFTSNDYYNYYDLNRVELNTLATKDLAEVLRGDINLENIDFDRDMKSIPFADVLNRVEGNINILGNKLYKPKGWTQPKLDWRYNQSFSYEDANRLERNLLLLYNYAKGNIDKIPHCGMYTCGEVVV